MHAYTDLLLFTVVLEQILELWKAYNMDILYVTCDHDAFYIFVLPCRNQAISCDHAICRRFLQSYGIFSNMNNIYDVVTFFNGFLPFLSFISRKSLKYDRICKGAIDLKGSVVRGTYFYAL